MCTCSQLPTALASAWLLFVAVFSPAAVVATESIELHLEVTINGRAVGMGTFIDRDRGLWASVATLRGFGLAVPGDPQDVIKLTDLPDAQVIYDVAMQTVALHVASGILAWGPTIVKPEVVTAHSVQTSPGALLNYSVYGSAQEHQTTSLSAFTELRAFGGRGVLSTTVLSATTGHADVGGVSNMRLDSSYTHSIPERLLAVQMGDLLTADSSWSRSTRLGGLQVGSKFALQPYRPVTPLSSFVGNAALPSQVELYVDGLRQMSAIVPSGPFRFDDVALAARGAQGARVVVTDVQGHVTSLDFPAYTAPDLLRQGLQEWSVEAGFVRLHYGARSFSYAPEPAVSTTWRRGVSNVLTTEFHAEGSGNFANAGVGGSLLVGQLGVISAAGAASRRPGVTKAQWRLAYGWAGPRTALSIAAQRSDVGYADLAAMHGSASPRSSVVAQFNLDTGIAGNAGLGYIALRQSGADRSRFLSASWNKSLTASTALFFSARQDLGHGHERSWYLGIHSSPAARMFVSSTVARQGVDEVYTLDAIRSVPTRGGMGWRAQLQRLRGELGGGAEARLQGDHGELSAGVRDMPGARSAYAGAAGSMILMHGGLFAARSIADSFAVVSTDGVPGVPVRLHNNVVGSTNARGTLLVTQLNAWQNNSLSIDPMALPANLRIDSAEAVATPADRAGTVVRFGMHPMHAATVLLIDDAGVALPVGSTAHLRGNPGESSIVGFEGIAWFEALGLANELDVDTPRGRCVAHFDYPVSGAEVVRIGPLRCVARPVQQ